MNNVTEIMREKLTVFIERLKTNPNISSYNESETKQAIILPLLGFLGWDRDNPDEVKPEYSVENGRVDFSLRLNNVNKLFIEVKQTGEDLERETYQAQLLDYSFQEGVKLAVLTNGTTWFFYLPLKEGGWRARKFYTIDIKEQGIIEVASKFRDFLLKENVQSGKAIQHAESVHEGKRKKQLIDETLPKAWDKILLEPDKLLIELLADTTEKLCGFKPDIDIVKQFIDNYKKGVTVTAESEEQTGRKRRKKTPDSDEPTYMDSYRKQLDNPNNLISKIKRYIEEKNSVTDSDLRQICVNKFGCANKTSGSIGACVRVLEEDGYIKIEGRGDSKRLISIIH